MADELRIRIRQEIQAYEDYIINQLDDSKFQEYGTIVTKILEKEIKNIYEQKSVTELSKHQINAVLETANHFQSFENSSLMQPALITAPSGSGKLGMIALLPYVLKSRKILIVTPSLLASKQVAKVFGHPTHTYAFFLECKILKTLKIWKKLKEVPLMPTKSEDLIKITDHNLVILNVQNLIEGTGQTSKNIETSKTMLNKLHEFDSVIVYEAHHYPIKSWLQIVEWFKGKKLVFLTATPFTSSNNNQIIHMADSMSELQLKEVFSVKSIEFEGINKRKQEFIENSLSCFIGENQKIEQFEYINKVKSDIQDILDKQKRIEPRIESPQAIVIVRTNNEAREIAKALGSLATFVTSGNSGEVNLAEFTRGKKQIAVFCGKPRDSYKNPNITLCVILFKCQSKVLFEQICGICIHINHTLSGMCVDKTTGTLLSYDYFQQKKMWESRNIIATENPIDEESDKEED